HSRTAKPRRVAKAHLAPESATLSGHPAEGILIELLETYFFSLHFRLFLLSLREISRGCRERGNPGAATCARLQRHVAVSDGQIKSKNREFACSSFLSSFSCLPSVIKNVSGLTGTKNPVAKNARSHGEARCERTSNSSLSS